MGEGGNTRGREEKERKEWKTKGGTGKKKGSQGKEKIMNLLHDVRETLDVGFGGQEYRQRGERGGGLRWKVCRVIGSKRAMLARRKGESAERDDFSATNMKGLYLGQIHSDSEK